MEVFKANYGYNALIMLCVLSAILSPVILYDEHWYFYAFYPFVFYLLPYIDNSRTKYQITSKELVIEKIFNKQIISTNRIRRVEIAEKKKWIQILNGKPNRYVSVQFNKFDEIHVYPENPEKFQEMLLKQKEAEIIL
jgi:hypothetical protein